MTSHDIFTDQGYLLPLPVLTPAEVVRYRAVIDRYEAQLGREKSAIGLLQKHLEDPDVWALSSHPRVLDAAEAALGPDLVLIATHFFIKYPDNRDKFVAWHQDVTYWGFEPPLAATVWLAIDDADIENGCMRVLPRTHTRGVLTHGKASKAGNLLSVNQAIPDELLDPTEAVDFPLTAGWASVHDGLLVHGSNPNRSSRRRAGMTIRFTTPEIKLTGNESLRVSWAPILVRGQDRFGRLPLRPAPTFA